MKITGPLFKWFGSKWLSSKKLPPPKHKTIYEPFAGGAGYSLRYADHEVIICERDQNIFELWCWFIRSATESMIREIPLNITPGTNILHLGLSRGQALLLKSWQRTNNVGHTWTISPWGNSPGQWTENTRSRVASEFHLVKHWKVFSDGMEILRYNDPFSRIALCERGTWFIDPPYQYNYDYRQPKIAYDELAELIKSKPGQKIVCEAVCQKTGAVPNWLPFEFFGERITSRRKSSNNHHSKELIWTEG